MVCGSWISSMSCSATSLATTEPCRKKRPHQWISISMPCVPLLPMLVLGTCPHLDSFYALVKKQTEPRTEPSKHHPVHFYQPECFAKNQPAKRHNLYSGPKLEIGPEKSHSKILENAWKCRIILLQRSPKKITQIPQNASTPVQTNLPSASMTWQRNHSQPLRAPEWMISSSRSLATWVFFFQVNFLFGQSPIMSIMSRDKFSLAECYYCACCVGWIISGFSYSDLVG